MFELFEWIGLIGEEVVLWRDQFLSSERTKCERKRVTKWKTQNMNMIESPKKIHNTQEKLWAALFTEKWLVCPDGLLQNQNSIFGANYGKKGYPYLGVPKIGLCISREDGISFFLWNTNLIPPITVHVVVQCMCCEFVTAADDLESTILWKWRCWLNLSGSRKFLLIQETSFGVMVGIVCVFNLVILR